jgi:hypothetical protein
VYIEGMTLKVTCDRCHCELEHICDPQLKEAAKNLLKWTPECGFPVEVEGAEDAEGAPFFSGMYLYPLLGKEDARTLTSLVNWLIRQAGLDPTALREEVERELEAEQQKAAREAEREQRKAARKALKGG